MFLKRLQLTNFRNYSILNLEFDNRATILLGNNAVGKSNLLEAVYFLSTTKSARVDIDSELIKEGKEFSRVEGVISPVIATPDLIRGKQSSLGSNPTKIASSLITPRNDDTDLEIAMQVSEGQFSKRLKVNGIPRRTVDFIGHLPAVIFYPTDINMITGSPSLRRWHLDLSLAQVDPSYKKALSLYEQVLTARNRILKKIKEGEAKIDELDFWTAQLLEQGQIISQKRRAFFEFLDQLKKPLGDFEFKFNESSLTPQRLEQYGTKEIQAAATLIGPHRDDFVAQVRNSKSEVRNLAHFGSRGEQRTATLAFKLAQLEYMAKVLDKRPILLLDDVFSELDASHRAKVIEIVKLQQTILATVELEHIPQSFLDSARVLKVDNSRIIEPGDE